MEVFMHGQRDNPLTALVSFPHVLGHEAAGVIEQVGPAVRERRVGERVVLNPWLSCAPRGVAPVCEACAAGDYPLCRNFTEGRFSPGMHAGNCRDVSGGYAEYIALHESQAFPIPDGVPWEAAALADPFSVSLHGVLRQPPPGGPALVFGCGTLGLLTIAILRLLYPDVPVLAVARYPHQIEQARRLGAAAVLAEAPEAVVEGVAKFAGSPVLRSWTGAPWLLRGATAVYDTVGTPKSVELALRVASPRAPVVVSGVNEPRRFEWTPLYFKEISVAGSNAFGIETFEGRRLHAMQIYLELLQRGLDVAPIITHRFPLERYKEAFLTHRRKGKTSAVKIMFTFDDEREAAASG
jgi:threonine dehydrogenase-like Zn-dependent dehydrogenase